MSTQVTPSPAICTPASYGRAQRIWSEGQKIICAICREEVTPLHYKTMTAWTHAQEGEEHDPVHLKPCGQTWAEKLWMDDRQVSCPTGCGEIVDARTLFTEEEREALEGRRYRRFLKICLVEGAIAAGMACVALVVSRGSAMAGMMGIEATPLFQMSTPLFKTALGVGVGIGLGAEIAQNSCGSAGLSAALAAGVLGAAIESSTEIPVAAGVATVAIPVLMAIRQMLNPYLALFTALKITGMTLVGEVPGVAVGCAVAVGLCTKFPATREVVVRTGTGVAGTVLGIAQGAILAPIALLQIDLESAARAIGNGVFGSLSYLVANPRAALVSGLAMMGIEMVASRLGGFSSTESSIAAEIGLGVSTGMGIGVGAALLGRIATFAAFRFGVGLFGMRDHPRRTEAGLLLGACAATATLASLPRSVTAISLIAGATASALAYKRTFS